ncbi:MAG: hypothetical protein DI587_17165 [Variovorax paradoxus]|nr:MAG: hypothetical protein DI583_17165 [Variovorax paradoxus]PZQ08965.1 MAG: hypothetical protein DI587_17165 [Variovorax paradoxus]
MRNTFAIYLLHRPGEQMAALGEPVVFKAIEHGALMGGPTIELGPTDAQLLMDELWRAGLRPTEGTGSAGSLAATERHLKDMQRIAFQLLPATGDTHG